MRCWVFEPYSILRDESLRFQSHRAIAGLVPFAIAGAGGGWPWARGAAPGSIPSPSRRAPPRARGGGTGARVPPPCRRVPPSAEPHLRSLALRGATLHHARRWTEMKATTEERLHQWTRTRCLHRADPADQRGAARAGGAGLAVCLGVLPDLLAQIAVSTCRYDDGSCQQWQRCR